MASCQAGFLLFCIFSYTKAYLDIEELKSINYGIDFVNEPVLISENSPAGSVQLSTKHGQPYQCSFPDVQAEESKEKEEEKVAVETGILDLLKPMEDNPCLVHNKDWWSYEFCYGKYVRQFHAEDGKISGLVVYLGLYDKDHKWDDTEDEESRKDVHWLNRYHSQHFVNGSKCDLTGAPRQAEVRFVCEEGNGDYIARVDEPEICAYVLHVHTTKLCHHPYLKPPISRKPVPITCNPLVTEEEYEIYLLEEEEKKKQEAVQRKQDEWIKRMINSDKENRMKELKKITKKRYEHISEKEQEENQDENPEDEIGDGQEMVGKSGDSDSQIGNKNVHSGGGKPVYTGDDNAQSARSDGSSTQDNDKSVDNRLTDTSTNTEEGDVDEEEIDVDKLVDEAIGSLSGMLVNSINEELQKLKEQDEEEEEEEEGGKGTNSKKAVLEKNKHEMVMDFKVIQNPEELHKFLKTLSGKDNKQDEEDEEEDEHDEEMPATETKEKGMKSDFQSHSGNIESHSGDSDIVTDEDTDVVQEFDKGVSAVTENEEHRHGVSLHKENIRHAVTSKFDEIVNEAKEEMAKEGMEGEINKEQTFRELAKTLNSLLNRLEKSEKELKEMDKNIEEAKKKKVPTATLR